MTTRYILRFDDVAPGMAWSRFLPLKSELEQLGIKSLLGVVPDCRDPKLYHEARKPDFFDWVRRWAEYGDSIAQHGTYHVYDQPASGILGINAKSEFAGHPYKKQVERLTHGKRILEREGVWQPYFMAPAHSFDETTLDALHALGFKAVTDGYGLFPYRHKNIVLVPQLTSFPLRPGFGICTIGLHVNSMNPMQARKVVAFAEIHRKNFMRFDEAVKLTPDTRKLGHAVLRGASFILLKGWRMRRAHRGYQPAEM